MTLQVILFASKAVIGLAFILTVFLIYIALKKPEPI